MDESGAEHQLYSGAGLQPFVPSEPGPHTHFYVTNDGSYLRAKYWAGVWTIYYPDGSTRQAGNPTDHPEKNAYVAPQFHQNAQQWPCPQEPWEVTNPWTHGWWVTKITDRAGNTSEITYMQPGGQNLPGSIDQIKDPYDRIITFNYSYYAPTEDNLLSSIQYPSGSSETYTYTTTSHTFTNGTVKTWPVLASATDAAQMQVRYEYVVENNNNPARYFVRPQMEAIYYPTGAVVRYTYIWATYSRQRLWGFTKFLEQHNDLQFDHQTVAVSKKTIEAAQGTGGTPNKLSWTWERRCRTQPYLWALGYTSMVYPVITRDPMGTQEVYYFAAGDAGTERFPPGKEILKTRRFPGSTPLTKEYLNGLPTANDFDVWDKVVSWRQQTWEFGGGDTWRCQDIGRLGGETNRYGNSRAYLSEEGERNAAAAILWKKRSESVGWDGFGHYSLTFQTDGTPYMSATTSRVTGMRYQAPDDLPLFSKCPHPGWSFCDIQYQTDHLLASFTGMADAAIETFEDGNGQLSLRIAGKFRVSQMEYAAVTGFLTKRRDLVGTAATLTYELSTNTVVANPQSGADKVLNLQYDGSGNISKLVYSRADAAPTTYGFNFEWESGMVSRMYRDNSPYGDEFNRGIETTTSLILNNTDSNSLTTSFQYDALNRLTKISPPNGEFATTIVYPNDSTSPGTAHDILFYRGPEGYAPSVSDSITGLDAGAAYQHYIFDDLGRLVKTRSIHPEGYLTETLTSYDPLGKAFFSSLPYRYQGATQPVAEDLSWSSKLVETGDVFVSTILRNPNQTAPGNAYGSISSFYDDAVLSTDFQQLLGLHQEPLDRPIWAFKPDLSKTKTTYSGLDSAMTLFGLKTETDPAATSTTWYYKDLWGRLKEVTPPEGTNALYTYNELDQLKEVNLSGQKRTFTYDALGRILTANNPENGLTTYLGYDCIGNLLGAQDANGTAGGYKLVNDYDNLGRLLMTKQVTVATGAEMLVLMENTYDSLSGMDAGKSLGKLVKSLSRQIRAEDATKTTTATQAFIYGGLNGRISLATLTTTAGSPTGLETAYPVEISYDLYGQTLEVTPPTGGSITNDYTHGAISERGLQYRPVMSSFTYDPAGALTGLAFAAGPSLATKMDAFERPTGFSLRDATGTLQWGNGSYASEATPYTYDGAGNIASIGAMGLDGFGAPRKDAFTYDSLSRLTKAVVNRIGQTTPHVYDYTYDDFGNLLGRTESTPTGYATLKEALTAQGVVSTSAEAYIKQVNFTAVPATTGGVTNNRLDSVIRAGGATGVAAAPATYLYDLNGNLIEDDNNVYAYDALNRQTAVYLRDTSKADHKGALLSQAFYDAAGERAARVTYDSVGAYQFTAYLRDGAAVLWEQTSSRNNAPPRRDKTYLYAAGKMAYTQTMALPAFTGSYYKLLSGGGAALSEPELSLEGRSQVAQAAYTVYNLSADITAFEVRVARVQVNGGNHSDGRGQDDGNSNSNSEENRVQTARVTQPAEGWGDGMSTVRFDHLQPGWTYTVSFVIETTLGTIELFGATRLELETGSFTVPDSPAGPRCWARHHWERTGAAQAEEELTVGWGGVASGSHAAYLVNMKVGTSQTALTPEPVTGSQVTVSVAALVIPEGAQNGSLVVSATGGSGTVQTAVPGGVTPNIPIFPRVTYINEYYATDHLGTVRAVFDPSAATPLHTFDYEPFGIEITPNDVEDNTHKFTGHERDAETGNDYMHFRFYAAGMGRFQKPDNMSGGGGNPQGWNLYSYVSGNPVNFNDPTGHKETPKPGGSQPVNIGDGTSPYAFCGGGPGIANANPDRLYVPVFDSQTGVLTWRDTNLIPS